MKYLHKIETRERDLTIATPQTAVAGLQVIVGTAPVNMTDDPAATVNTPIVCESSGSWRTTRTIRFARRWTRVSGNSAFRR